MEEEEHSSRWRIGVLDCCSWVAACRIDVAEMGARRMTLRLIQELHEGHTRVVVVAVAGYVLETLLVSENRRTAGFGWREGRQSVWVR